MYTLDVHTLAVHSLMLQITYEDNQLVILAAKHTAGSCGMSPVVFSVGVIMLLVVSSEIS